MKKSDILDEMLKLNNGFLRTSMVVERGISKPTLSEYVRKNGLVRVAHGLYTAEDAWQDDLFIVQTRYPLVVFSHETALFLLRLTDREPLNYSVTLQSGMNASGLTSEGIKVYKVKSDLLEVGLMETKSLTGQTIRVYNPERTICDLVRYRRRIDTQDLQTAIRSYVNRPDKNIPQLMRFAETFSVQKTIRQYLEVLLP